MKKLMSAVFASLLVMPLMAQETEKKNETAAEPIQAQWERSEMWPAFIAVGQWPRSADVVGLRLTIPYSTSQENVSGVDVGFWGESMYFEGVQMNILRNKSIDGMSGVQAGIYNTTGHGQMVGVQAGLWNEALSFRGVQAGLINTVGEGEGFQIGVINRAETFHGYQIGFININRAAELQFMPIINIGF